MNQALPRRGYPPWHGSQHTWYYIYIIDYYRLDDDVVDDANVVVDDVHDVVDDV